MQAQAFMLILVQSHFHFGQQLQHYSVVWRSPATRVAARSYCFYCNHNYLQRIQRI